jgi:hypothetical protein
MSFLSQLETDPPPPQVVDDKVQKLKQRHHILKGTQKSINME